DLPECGVTLLLQLLDAVQQRLVLLAVAGGLGAGSAEIALNEFERQACTALPCAVQVRRNGLLWHGGSPAERAPLRHVMHRRHRLPPSRERPAYRSDPPALIGRRTRQGREPRKQCQPRFLPPPQSAATVRYQPPAPRCG